MDLIEELKAHARVLHRRAAAKDEPAQRRMRSLRELAGRDVDALAREVKRRHGLAVVAHELGFDGWPHAVAVLQGAPTEDYGTLLYTGGGAHWNIWSASYEEARDIRVKHGGYLLAYKRHFFITDRFYVETLGLDPDDEDWTLIGRDWARPARPDARQRLYATLIRQKWAQSVGFAPPP